MSLTRRSLLVNTGLLGLARAVDEASPAAPVLRMGMITDVHHAHLETKGTRCYREALGKLTAAVSALNELKPDLAVCLGDLIDSGDGSLESEKQNLREAEAEFAKLACPRHYVFGNHCLDMLSKEEYCALTTAKPGHYFEDRGDWRLIFLDACFRADGVAYQRKNFKWTDTFIPDEQRAWLKERLAEAPKHVLVMVHQRLDGLDLNHGVLNHAAVREILAASGKVRAVLAGHSHKNALSTVDGIPFLVARAIVDDPGPDNNAYGLVELFADGGVRVRGYGKQATAVLKG